MNKLTSALLLAAALMTAFSSCEKTPQEDVQPAARELTVLFSPGGSFSGAGYDDAILKAVMESAATNQNFVFRLLRPGTLAEARSQAQKWQADADDMDALILCGPQYEDLAGSLKPEKGRVLLLDSDKSFADGVASIQLKRYGGAYLAGALSHPFQMLLIKALNGDRMLDTVAGGIEEGYQDAGGEYLEQLVLSDSYAGLNMPDQLFNQLFEGFTGLKFGGDTPMLTGEACLVPVCGASRAGAYSYSRNMFTVSLGIGEDCSAYSEMLPYSLIFNLGAVVKDYIQSWIKEESWPAHADFGLSTGHVGILYNPRFFEEKTGMVYNYKLLLEDYKKLEAQYLKTALEKEARYAY